jgi:excisionase family DNA binding protein
MWTMSELEFLTAEQVAEKLQLHPRTVRRLLASGELPGKRIGGREWRVSVAALRAYMENPTQPTPGKPASAKKSQKG